MVAQDETTAWTVLLVEDDPEVTRVVRDGLVATEFVVYHAPTLAEAERAVEQSTFRAIILDLTLPDGDGLDLASSIRAEGDETPILVLSARDSVPDRLLGFDRGADDYVGKPFDVNELAARLRVMIRRAGVDTGHRLRVHDLELDLLSRTASRPGLEASLSDREAELLAFMMRRPNEVLSREYLLEELWGDEIDRASNLVNVYVNLLRNKIEAPTQPKLIHTVRGAGYMLSTREPEELLKGPG